jgi:hypothetical protein
MSRRRWGCCAQELATPEGRGRPGEGQVEALWGVVVEGDLLHSSHERKYLAFTLFNLLLPYLGCVSHRNALEL